MPMHSVRVVGERQGHDRQFLSDGFNEYPKGECVAYPSAPFVDGIHRGRGDNNRI
jgi:hypothetical protein